MSAVGLMFVGAVLFVNGLLFLGRIDAKSAAPFNLFVGALQVAIPFYLIATAPTHERHPARRRDLPVRVHLPVRGDQQPGGPAAARARLVLGLGGDHGRRLRHHQHRQVPRPDDRPAVAAVVGAVGAVLAGARTGRDPLHAAGRLADPDPVLHHLHDPRLPAAARGVGPRAARGWCWSSSRRRAAAGCRSPSGACASPRRCRRRPRPGPGCRCRCRDRRGRATALGAERLASPCPATGVGPDRFWGTLRR